MIQIFYANLTPLLSHIKLSLILLYMALINLLPKLTKLTAVSGLGIFGITILPSYINTNNNQESPISLQNDESKNIGSLFISNIKPKIIWEMMKIYKWQSTIAISSIGTLFFIKTIGFDSLMYASRRQLSNGISNITKSLTFIIDNVTHFKSTVYTKLDNLTGKIESNHENVKLTIKQKSDELKCEMKDIKGSQNKTNGILDLMSDKINIIEEQGKFISKGVYLLCNTVINDSQNVSSEHLEQLRVYNHFDNVNKRTEKNTL